MSNTETTTGESRPAWRATALRSAMGLVGAATCFMALLGCNTTEGVGEDIRAVGDAIDDAAEDAND